MTTPGKSIGRLRLEVKPGQAVGISLIDGTEIVLRVTYANRGRAKVLVCAPREVEVALREAREV